jgi:hypothetical protein
MANPVIINPTLTQAGQAAAFNANNNGLELKITHVSFGTAHYDPVGTEVALVAPVGNKVTVAGASRPTPFQIRMISSWRENVGQVAIGEIAFWAENVLVFVWSKADGTVASYKTDGVSYVLFNDLAFTSVPANSISFVVDPDESVALAALAAHEGAFNAHPQYALRAKFPDYQGHLWGDVSGSANAIALTLPAIVDLTQYIKGNRFSFKAALTNTGDTTINVNGVGAVQVLKTGGVALTAGSIVAGGVYDVYHDGAKFQLTAGAGFASSEVTDAEANALTAVNSTSWVSLRRLITALLKFAKLDGATFTGDVKGLTPVQFDNDTSFVTSAFLKRMGLEFGDYTNYGATAALTLSDVGKVAAFAGAGAMTATLPTGGMIPRGAYVEILCGSGTVTVTAAAGDSIDAVNYPGNITMGQGDVAGFIRIGSLWRLVSGSVFLKYAAVMSGPYWTTQPQFANDTSFSTTAFVQRALGNLSGGRSIPGVGTVNLGVVDAGQFISLAYGGVQSVVLPVLADVPVGTTIALHNPSGVDKTIAGAGADKISPDGSQLASVILRYGDTAFFTKETGVWRMTGSAALRYSVQFAGSNAALGYQKLPNGQQECRGTFTASATPGAAVAVTFPQGFGRADEVIITPINPSTTTSSAWADSLTASGFNGRCNIASLVCHYIAKGTAA